MNLVKVTSNKDILYVNPNQIQTMKSTSDSKAQGFTLKTNSMDNTAEKTKLDFISGKELTIDGSLDENAALFSTPAQKCCGKCLDTEA